MIFKLRDKKSREYIKNKYLDLIAQEEDQDFILWKMLQLVLIFSGSWNDSNAQNLYKTTYSKVQVI